MTLSPGRFTMLNSGFSCLHCGAEVPPARATARNHCPHCLHSLHVDVQPGDRAAGCGGLMPAIGYEVSGADRVTLVFRCQRCGALGRNKALQNGPQPDAWTAILRLTPIAPTSKP